MTHYPHTRGGLPCNECPNSTFLLDECAEIHGIPGLIDSRDELVNASFQSIMGTAYYRLVDKERFVPTEAQLILLERLCEKGDKP